MGLLADIYSGSDSLKRKVKGLLADPLGTIEQKINQFGEDHQAAINNAQDATGFGGNRSVLMSPQQKQQARQAMGDYASSMGLAGTVASKFTYPQDKALEAAQRNAALPVAKGGLGLRPDNTPLERAQAMGFDTPAFHGTPDDGIVRSRQFKNAMLGKTTQVDDAKLGHFTTNSGDAASEYIWRGGSTDGGNVLPLQLAGDRASVNLPGEWQPGRFDKVIDQSKRGGYDGLTIKGTSTLGKPGDYQVTFEPRNIRSRFAAFDPMRRNEADILGRADPELLKLIAGGGLLGAGGYAAFNDK